MPQSLRIALLVLAGAGFAGLIIYTFVRAFKNAIDPTRLAVKWIVTLLFAACLFWLAYKMEGLGRAFVILLAVPMAIILSFVWAPSIGQILFSPITSALDGGNEESDPAPLYS